jgi:hypothetical protein
MGDTRLKLTAGAMPYSDGSGHQVTATVERTDDGLMLRFEMIHHIPVDNWSDVRDVIQALCQSAIAIERSQGRG